MKIKLIRLSGYCLTIGLIVASTMVLSACGSTAAASSTTTQPPSSASSTTTAVNTITSTSKSTKTTATTKVTAVLVSIAITPNPSPNLKLGPTTITFTATGTYSDGIAVDISTLVTWTSSDPTIAAFTQLSGGLLMGMSVGTVTITASLSGITSPTVSVTTVPLSVFG